MNIVRHTVNEDTLTYHTRRNLTENPCSPSYKDTYFIEQRKRVFPQITVGTILTRNFQIITRL